MAEDTLRDRQRRLARELIMQTAADLIVEMVRQHRINQLVIGTLGRTGIPGFVIGNTAERLLGEVSCSEFVVKPPGFASPFVG